MTPSPGGPRLPAHARPPHPADSLTIGPPGLTPGRSAISPISGGDRTPDPPASIGAGQTDDRDRAVGFLLVAGVAWLDLGDPLPGLRACVSVELRGGHPHVTAADVDPDLVGMRGDVVVPRGMMA